MAPAKRKTEGASSVAAAAAAAAAPPMRVTRAAAKRSAAAAASSDPPPKKGKKAKVTKKKKNEKEDEGAAVQTRSEKNKAEEETEEGGEGDASDSENVLDASNKTIVVEHCKQCTSFKTRANLVKEGLEKADIGISVKLNPDKPRRGCFEIRQEGGKKFISLLGMNRPFKRMKELDMDKVVSDIIDEISKAS